MKKLKLRQMETKVNNKPCETVCCIYGVSTNEVMRDRWLKSVMSPGKDYGKWSPGWCNRQCGVRVNEKGKRPPVEIVRKATDRIRDNYHDKNTPSAFFIKSHKSYAQAILRFLADWCSSAQAPPTIFDWHKRFTLAPPWVSCHQSAIVSSRQDVY